ncbi:MAG TPA: DUF2231 domain-containing protein [Terriglobales bacterium]|nr:DUF2231 domain-containing protein [Terriglobales bacterium]
MANPFDLRSIVLARHAQHVVLVHFPIALFLSGVGFDVAARITRRAALAAAAQCNIAGAALFALPTVATGLLAWQWQLEGQKLKGTLLLHLVLGAVSGLLICIAAWLRWRNRKRIGHALAAITVFEFVTVIVIALTAHLGGVLSGVTSLE